MYCSVLKSIGYQFICARRHAVRAAAFGAAVCAPSSNSRQLSRLQPADHICGVVCSGIDRGYCQEQNSARLSPATQFSGRDDASFCKISLTKLFDTNTVQTMNN